jgi:hypothetical protein
MTPRIEEGGPAVPVPEYPEKGLRERDVFIAAALSSAQTAWALKPDGGFVLTPDEIADRACRIAAATMERKERAP